MGRIATLLSWISGTKILFNLGGSEKGTAPQFSSAGDDSQPIKGDIAAILDTNGKGGSVAVGYIDIKNLPKTAEGEKRIYSRRPSGNMICELWLKNDGTIVITNGIGNITMGLNGTVNINGVKINLLGQISAPVTPGMVVDLVTHTHTALNVPPTPTPEVIP